MSNTNETRVTIISSNISHEIDGFARFMLSSIGRYDNYSHDNFSIPQLTMENDVPLEDSEIFTNYLKVCEGEMNIDRKSRLHVLRQKVNDPEYRDYKNGLETYTQYFKMTKDDFRFYGGNSNISIEANGSFSSAQVYIPFIKQYEKLESTPILKLDDAINRVNEIQNGLPCRPEDNYRTYLSWHYDEIKKWRLAYLIEDVWESENMQKNRKPAERQTWGMLKLPIQDYTIDAITGEQIL